MMNVRTPIFNAAYYTYENGVMILKTQKYKWVKAILLCVILLWAIFPSHVADAFQRYTPVQVIEQRNIEAAAKKIVSINNSLELDEAQTVVENAKRWGLKFGIEPSLLLGIMFAESTFNKHAISSVGAFGFMQVLPRWHTDKIIKAREKLGKPEVFDTEVNIYLGAWILKDCLSKYGNVNTALKCYNGSVGMETNYDAKVLRGKQIFDAYI